jgi:hypothetical protein
MNPDMTPYGILIDVNSVPPKETKMEKMIQETSNCSYMVKHDAPSNKVQ